MGWHGLSIIRGSDDELHVGHEFIVEHGRVPFSYGRFDGLPIGILGALWIYGGHAGTGIRGAGSAARLDNLHAVSLRHQLSWGKAEGSIVESFG